MFISVRSRNDALPKRLTLILRQPFRGGNNYELARYHTRRPSAVTDRVSVFISRRNQAAPNPADDRRQSIRHAAVNQVAKIRLNSGREELCLLRDISAEGLRAEIYIPLEVGAQICVELRTAHSARGRIVWVRGDEIGVSFEEAIPAAAMLAHCSFDQNAAKLRPPRLKVNLRGLLRIDDQAKMVDIGNISQAGLQIAAPEPLRANTACTIVLSGLPARGATICWWREGAAGLMLAEPFDYATFAQWRSRCRG